MHWVDSIDKRSRKGVALTVHLIDLALELGLPPIDKSVVLGSQLALRAINTLTFKSASRPAVIIAHTFLLPFVMQFGWGYTLSIQKLL